MQIYADPITVNCRKVLAGLQLIGAPYELKHVDYFKGEQKAEPYASINPNLSIPAMVDGDLVLWESNAILQYAADKTGSNGTHTSNDIAVLWPPTHAPLIVAAYITQCPGPESARAALLASIGSLVTGAFA